MLSKKIIDRKKLMIDARKVIKQKMKLLKGEKIESSKILESRFQPIIQPLQQLVKSFKETPIKKEPKTENIKEEEFVEQDVEETQTIPSFLQTPLVQTYLQI